MVCFGRVFVRPEEDCRASLSLVSIMLMIRTAHPPEYYDYKYGHSVGTICASTTMKVVDPASGKLLGPNEPGELCARGPQIVMGYLNNEKATAETFDKDGFLHTGDLGMVDDEGLVYVQDRIKELIKVKGVSCSATSSDKRVLTTAGIGVAPAELEDLLLGHEKVSDCAVMGVTDETAGERPKAFIVLKPDHQASEAVGEEVIQYVEGKKDRNKWIREVEFVDEIPKSASGKILRRMLKDRAKLGVKGLVVKKQEKARL